MMLYDALIITSRFFLLFQNIQAYVALQLLILLEMILKLPLLKKNVSSTDRAKVVKNS